jgi:hypothetical protein
LALQEGGAKAADMESPVMGAMSEMSGSIAYNIMKYMDVKVSRNNDVGGDQTAASSAHALQQATPRCHQT